MNMKLTDKNLLTLVAIIFVTALAVRFLIIELRPLHHDEGVFAISFIKPLYESGEYRYNPALTYHGPFLYYAGALAFRIFGVNEFALRFFGVLFSSMLIPLLYLLRKQMGNEAVIASALLIAASPIFTYYSNFSSSHEVFLLFFELAAIASFFRFMEGGDKRYLYAGFASLGLMFTTKEASYAVVFLFFLFIAFGVLATKTKKSYRESAAKNVSDSIGFVKRYKKEFLYAAIIGFTVFAVFYTSFFRHADNLLPTITGAIPGVLSVSAESTGHHKPFFYYTELLLKFELPLVLLALIGLVYWRKTLFTKFSAFLLVATWLMFSVVAYKTPWNILHIMLPLVIAAGIGAQKLYDKIGAYAIPAIGAAVAFSALLSFNANFVSHSAQDNTLAYVTTAPDIMNMINKVYGMGNGTEIKVLSGDYWPLPWYLRNYRAGYYGSIIDEPDADIVIVKKEDKDKLNLTDSYESADYQLRYGVWLTALFRANQTLQD